MNWRAWFGWTWSQFLVTYYPQVIRSTAEAWDMSIAQLLTHYSSNNSHALSTYVTSMDAIILYNPNMPAFDIDLSTTQSSFELADSVSNTTAQGSTFDNEDGGKRSSRSGGVLSHKSIGQWWPTVSVQDS
ncbi:hypothetical protein ARMGADRAFT_1090747 [Armillaria gallica]|uniref:Uncharacterized protein n=1 Tax=Armillaria gallica TaxID=47427 RepID=A0A2H3CZ48_ARMGA|nr:hypothetical protein ARMGADRAFT_1090747 [Armillaria gallica]